MKAHFQKLTVIGLGLIGSSITRAAHKHKIADSITAVDSNEVSLVYARKHGFVDHVGTDAASAVVNSDIVIIATPITALADICRAIAPKLSPGTIVMDTGSVKQLPLAVMTEYLPKDVLVVPAHPIAGSEQFGVQAGTAELFEKKRVIITPEAPLTHDELKRINHFWSMFGARVEAMPAAMHDVIYGYVSHLPQLLAYAAAETVEPSEQLAKFLRIARSDRVLWRGIFMLNRDNILPALDRYLDAISHIEGELRNAPQDVEITASEPADIDALLARIAASCLITTVMEAEKKAGVPFARFAGAGFSDFTSPATYAPEEDLERISNHYKAVLPKLSKYEAEIKRLRKTLE